MKFLIGLDVGTTNIKGSIYSANGEYLNYKNINYCSYSFKNNFHEQILDYFFNCFKALGRNMFSIWEDH